MFRHRPTLAAELLSTSFGLTVPQHDRVHIGSGETTPIEHRADAVVELRSGDRPVLAIVVEVQLKSDPDKRYSWPVYLTMVRARLRCPTVLLVVSPRAATARWCATPVELGPGNRFVASVLGPDQIPALTDPEVAVRNPELAVLSAIAHGGRKDGVGVLEALPPALVSVDEDHWTMYYDLVLTVLPVAARRHLEELMTTTYQYQSDFARKYFAEGEAQGEVRALLLVLAARGIDVPARLGRASRAARTSTSSARG